MKIKSLVVSILCAQGLVACGGGGTSAAPPGVGDPAPTPVPTQAVAGPVVRIDAAIANLYLAPHHFERTETVPTTNITYNGVADFSTGADVSVEGANVKSASVQRSLTKADGTAVRKSSEISYFQSAPYRLIATQSLDSSYYQVVSQQVALPDTSKAGDSGAFYNATVYESSAKKTVLSTSKYTWTVSADSADSLTFCVNSITISPAVPGTVANSECYKVSTSNATVPDTVIAVSFTVPK